MPINLDDHFNKSDWILVGDCFFVRFTISKGLRFEICIQFNYYTKHERAKKYIMHIMDDMDKIPLGSHPKLVFIIYFYNCLFNLKNVHFDVVASAPT